MINKNTVQHSQNVVFPFDTNTNYVHLNQKKEKSIVTNFYFFGTTLSLCSFMKERAQRKSIFISIE